jgi:hypothetical protein
MPSTDRIHPEFQEWKVGDKLWMYPPEKAGGLGHGVLSMLVPGRALGFVMRQIGTPPSPPYDASWSFVLRRIDDQSTRLLVRGQSSGARSLRAMVFDRLVFEPVHFVMERKTMREIKKLAEGGRPSHGSDVAEVLLWTITFALFIASAWRVLARWKWMRSWAAFLAAGVTFQILTFAQPSPVLGGLLVLGISALLWWPARRSRIRQPRERRHGTLAGVPSAR